MIVILIVYYCSNFLLTIGQNPVATIVSSHNYTEKNTFEEFVRQNLVPIVTASTVFVVFVCMAIVVVSKSVRKKAKANPINLPYAQSTDHLRGNLVASPISPGFPHGSSINTNSAHLNPLNPNGMDIQKQPKNEIIENSSNFTSSSKTWSANFLTGQGVGTISIPGYLLFDAEKDFKVLKQIGQGATASIYYAIIQNEEIIAKNKTREAALKMMTGTDAKTYKLEVALMGCIPSHPNIARFLGYFDNPVGYALKYYHGSLVEIIYQEDKWPALSQTLIRSLITDVAKGLAHLHKSGIVHFDIKPGNILYETRPGLEIPMFVISDFGFARPVGSDMSFNNEKLVKGLELPKKAGFTLRYVSPELLSNLLSKKISCEEKHFKCDVYALGIMMFEILSRSPPWPGVEKSIMIKLIIAGERPLVPLSLENDSNLRDLVLLMRDCWNQEPIARPSAANIISRVNSK